MHTMIICTTILLFGYEELHMVSTSGFHICRDGDNKMKYRYFPQRSDK